jgi:hypothetical protein
MKISMKKLGHLALAAGVVGLAMMPELAHAGGGAFQGIGAGGSTDLTTTLGQVSLQTSTVPAMVNWFAYIMGTAFVCFGIFKLKAHADNAAQNKLGPALGMLFTGAAFLLFPGVASMLQTSAAFKGGVTAFDNAAFK